jgi:soluble lytic murein transglycosylase-like protein
LKINRSAMGLAVAFVCLAVACVPGTGSREELIDRTLRLRADHLRPGERDEIARELTRAEAKTGVDVLLLLALMEEESHFKPRARSRRGALGLLQVRPSTGKDVCERNGIRWTNAASLYEPSVNILVGATYLAELQERFRDWDQALTAYNRGPTRVAKARKRGSQPSSRYARRIRRRYESLRAQAVP